MGISPSDMVLTLTRVYIRPEFTLNEEKGELDTLTERLVSPCTIKLGKVREQIGILGGVCEKFRGRRRWIGLRNSEVEAISKASKGIFSIISPPKLLITSYMFGLTSYRVVVPVKVLSSNQEEILSSWRSVASELRRMLDGRISRSLVRGSMASQYFSEIYPFYELEFSLPEVCARWEELKNSLIPKPSEIAFVVSPLKRASPPPELRLAFLPNPVYISRDGIFSFFHYSSRVGGKRRNVHLMRRKRRRIFRLAIDLSLGLKIFLENEDLWLMGTEDLWGALVGMVYLSPKVVPALMRGEGRKFLGLYSELLKVMDLFERFDSYENLFTFFFQSEKQVSLFAQIVRLLGGSPPRKMELLPLTDLQIMILKIMLMKESLDDMVDYWDGAPLECLSKFLCEYTRLLLRGSIDQEGDPTSLIEKAARKALPGESAEGCPGEFLKNIGSRRGRKEGLTVKEISILLKEDVAGLGRTDQAVRSSLRKLEEEGIILSKEARRGRARKRGYRTKKGHPVKVFQLNHSHPMVSYIDNLMKRSIIRAYERMAGNSCF